MSFSQWKYYVYFSTELQKRISTSGVKNEKETVSDESMEEQETRGRCDPERLKEVIRYEGRSPRTVD